MTAHKTVIHKELLHLHLKNVNVKPKLPKLNVTKITLGVKFALRCNYDQTTEAITAEDQPKLLPAALKIYR